MSEIVTNIPAAFLEEFRDEVLGTIPEEKAQQELKMQETARIMAMAGSVCVPGLGQKVASIPARLYFRLQKEYGDHPDWLKDFLKDNPQLCAPGYRPTRKGDFRHGHTYVNGEPVRGAEKPAKVKDQPVNKTWR